MGGVMEGEEGKAPEDSWAIGTPIVLPLPIPVEEFRVAWEFLVRHPHRLAYNPEESFGPPENSR